jgi:hypothetical protein
LGDHRRIYVTVDIRTTVDIVTTKIAVLETYAANSKNINGLVNMVGMIDERLSALAVRIENIECKVNQKTASSYSR